MKRVYWVLTAVILSVSGFASNLWATDVTCSNADYKGVYGFESDGAFANLPPQAALIQGPFAQAGVLIPDGAGNVTLHANASYNGIIFPLDTAATYSVTPDCHIEFVVPLPPPLTGVITKFYGQLAHNARQTVLMASFPADASGKTVGVLPAIQYKQDLRFCGPSDFSGAYQIDMGGATTVPASSAGPFHRLGRLQADGDGNFTATDLANFNSQLVNESFSGTYTVSADCFVSLSYTMNGGQYNIVGPIVGHGEMLLVMMKVPGWESEGTLRSLN